MDECRLCRQQRLRDKGLGVNDQSESYFLLDSPIIRKTEDHYGRCASCTPSTPWSPRTAPCATTIGRWMKRHRKPPAARPATRNLFKRTTLNAGSQGGLSSAVHGVPPGDEQGAHRLRRLPPQERARPQGPDPAGGQPGAFPGHRGMSALPPACRRGHAQVGPLAVERAFSLHP
jgi:hypothetical protein